ncbi:MAG: methyltransferase, TrmH family [Blastocatellia bacterium]|jgi:TrmH family RNA methyltransferase|nr:methyltransferase, TrmH family [Blastocatellia bacterium]
MNITSRDNSLLRHARAVRDGKIRESIFVEGMRLCEEALSSGLAIEAVIYSEEIIRKERAALLIEQLGGVARNVASVSEKLLESISYTKTPQGIVVLASRPGNDEATFKQKQPASAFLVILHGINNPVNVGAILRTAEAAGVTGAVTTAHTSDPFSPKALRGAMGSAFRVPIWGGAEYADVIGWCSERGIRTICGAARGPKAYTEVDWRGSFAVVVGPESTGLAPEEIALADEAVRIPMQGSVESLNVAVATGIILYEAKRQRISSGPGEEG